MSMPTAKRPAPQRHRLEVAQEGPQPLVYPFHLVTAKVHGVPAVSGASAGAEAAMVNSLAKQDGNYRTPPCATPYGLAWAEGPFSGLSAKGEELGVVALEVRDATCHIQPTPWATDDATKGLYGHELEVGLRQVFTMAWGRMSYGCFQPIEVDDAVVVSQGHVVPQSASEQAPVVELS